MVSGDYATHYADVRRHQEATPRMRARRFARRAALDALSLASIATREHALERPRVQILYFHHLMRDEERPFRALIERLLRKHAFLAYSDAVSRIASGAIDRPFISITFDDGLRNQLRAAEILRDYGIPACFFVSDAMAEPHSFEQVREFCARELWMPPMEFLSWPDLERLASLGHEIGNHTSRHRNLATLTAPELTDEISTSLATLRRRLGDVKHFAWPRGRFHEITPAAVAEVFRAGHVSCASAVRGAHAAGPTRPLGEICIRRDTVVAADPLRHTLHFLAKSSREASASTRDWPFARSG